MGVLTDSSQRTTNAGVDHILLEDQEGHGNNQEEIIVVGEALQFVTEQVDVVGVDTGEVAGDVSGRLCNQLENNFAEGDGSQGQEVEDQLGSGVCQSSTDSGCHRCADDHSQHNGNTKMLVHQNGDISTDTEECCMAHGDLAGVTEQNVQTGNCNNVQHEEAAKLNTIVPVKAETQDPGHSQHNHSQKDPLDQGSLFHIFHN